MDIGEILLCKYAEIEKIAANSSTVFKVYQWLWSCSVPSK